MKLKEIKKILNRMILNWQNEILDLADISFRADDLLEEELEMDVGEKLERSDPRSIVFEILYFLDYFYHIPMIKDDLPILLEFLNIEEGKELEAWDKWVAYWKNIDYKKRLKEIKNGYYEYNYCEIEGCRDLAINRYKTENQ